MSSSLLIPPLKCQGIKTKLVPAIQQLAQSRDFERWVEPFCGSCVVALNLQPKRALLCDSNVHIIRLYRDIQEGRVTSDDVRLFLNAVGQKLNLEGEEHYYRVRARFNAQPNPLDFLFLNRCCFNGVIRFNRSGKFNVPYGHKPERFSKSYVTKVANQVRRISELVRAYDWEFEAADFKTTLAKTASGDLVYCDPPYAGRHTDYFTVGQNQTT